MKVEGLGVGEGGGVWVWRVANDAVKCILHGAVGSSKFGGSARSRDDPQSGLRSTRNGNDVLSSV